jgi:hypothetical protein
MKRICFWSLFRSSNKTDNFRLLLRTWYLKCSEICNKGPYWKSDNQLFNSPPLRPLFKESQGLVQRSWRLATGHYPDLIDPAHAFTRHLSRTCLQNHISLGRAFTPHLSRTCLHTTSLSDLPSQHISHGRAFTPHLSRTCLHTTSLWDVPSHHISLGRAFTPHLSRTCLHATFL